MAIEYSADVISAIKDALECRVPSLTMVMGVGTPYNKIGDYNKFISLDRNFEEDEHENARVTLLLLILAAEEELGDYEMEASHED